MEYILLGAVIVVIAWLFFRPQGGVDATGTGKPYVKEIPEDTDQP